MRINRSQHLDTLRQTTADQPRPAASPARHRPVQDGFEPARKRGPALTSPQDAAVDILANELLKAIAQQLLAAANGMAAKTGDQGKPTPVASASDEFTPPPPVGHGDEGTPPPPVGNGGGDEWTPPPPPPVETTPVSGFSPTPPPGVVDPRFKGPSVRTEKRADTFPAQLPNETLAQYAMRTADKTGFNINQLGALTGLAGGLGQGPNATYAEVMDRYLNPTAYWSQADFDREKNLLEAERLTVTKVYTGPVALGSLSNDDRRYISGMEQRIPQLGDLWHKLVAGGHTDIARMINDTEYNLGPSSYDVRGYQGQMRQYVEDMLKKLGIPHP